MFVVAMLFSVLVGGFAGYFFKVYKKGSVIVISALFINLGYTFIRV